jgi:hypothetical protein
MTTKNYGPAVSGYLDPEGRSWETGVYQASKPVLDKELNLIQDAAQNEIRRFGKRSLPSGWLADDFLNTSNMTAAIFGTSATADELEIPQNLYAVVNNWLIRVGYTNAGGGTKNALDLGASPSGAGAKRTDLVVLEVWRKLLSASPDTDGKSPAGRIWWFGNVKIDAADDLTLNFADDILDGAVGSETTKRVQIQYRLRVIQGVDLFAYPMAMDDPTVVAHSVPPAAATPDGVATVFSYVSQSAAGDPGLWRAGDGVPTNTIDTVDGYMYAVPLMAVVRRNDTAFDRNSNHNGGVASPGPSDRPDGLFYDIVDSRDTMDLRMGCSPEGWNYRELTEKNLQFLFDNVLRTEMYRTLIGGGSDGNTHLWADEVGVLPGDGTTTGDTPGAEFIGQFDAVRRRYSDRVIHETVCLIYAPAAAAWVNNEIVTIDPSALPVYPYAPFNWASRAPSDISIVDFQGGNFSDSSSSQTALGNDFIVTNLGAIPQGSVALDIGTVPGGVVGQFLFIFVEIAYPAGQGLTKTPTAEFGTSSFSVNNPGALPADYVQDEYANLYWANREMELTYQTTQQTFSLTSDGLQNSITMPERVVILDAVNVSGAPYGGPMSVDDTGYVVTDDAATAFGSAGGNALDVKYKAVRPYPQNGEQVTIYYEARAPLTVPDAVLGTRITVIPRYIAPYIYVLTAGSGAQIEAYPFPYQYIAGAVYPASGGTFTGDHELDGASTIYVSNFSADTGFMKLETKIPMVPAPEQLTFQRVGGDVDIEGRSYFKTVPSVNYIPNAFAQPLSDPKKHKVLQPLLAELSEDTSFGPQGELVLVLVSRWATFDDQNSVGFLANLADNTTSASVYRLKGNLNNNRRG